MRSSRATVPLSASAGGPMRSPAFQPSWFVVWRDAAAGSAPG